MTALAVACVITFPVFGGPFGTINDIANAGIGLASVVLAWHPGVAAAPSYVNLGLAGCLGIYVAYPLWCWALAREAGP